MSTQSFVKSLILAGAMLAAMPAEATVFGFNTYAASGATPSNGTYGNARYFASTVGSTTINMKVTAWQADASTMKISNAYLGLFAQGLGVTGKNDQNGGNNYHQIDNVNGYDFILLQFDQAVSITTLGRHVFGLPNVGKDSDASLKAISLGGAAWDSALDLSGMTLGTSGWTNVAGDDQRSITTFNNTVTSTQWLIAAGIASGKNDGFKLDWIKVNYTKPMASVPEPATWAMMLTGFGLVGASARRRRQVAAAA